MFRFRRRAMRPSGVRFCDSCAEVTTADERARRRHEHTVAQARSRVPLR
ncbi:hypothetical protein ACQEVZ_03245 [Dactylosporangium sp. CA-152071]